MASKRVTMADIARELGISKNAVSLALRKKPGIGDALRQRVLDTAAKMRYEDARQAKIRGCILALIPQGLTIGESNTFYQQVCFHMESYAKEQGFQLIISSVSEAEEEAARPPALLGGIDCMGLMTVSNLSRPYCKMISGLGLRYVMVDQYYDTLVANCVTTANASGAYQLTEHLIENGHRKIQYFGMRFRTASLNDRWVGYSCAMSDHGLPELRNPYTWRQDTAKVDELAAIREAIDALDEMPTAFVCGHDRTARSVMEVLAQRGIRCPEDVSVVGFDNIQTPDVLALNLTTYQTPKVNIARSSIDLMLDTENRLPRRILIFGEMIHRDSVRDIRKSASS
ncbi:MAG TPA: LacI family DNA-binding transcriptional regulator [Clostridia bacterium]|nr:LacI family DNA-binding transcriptional regulator [Clostridia bacterium]